MSRKQSDYISYLLCVWRSNGGCKRAWQASLQDPHTGKRIGFASLDDLFAFLRQQTGVASGLEGDENEIEKGGDTY